MIIATKHIKQKKRNNPLFPPSFVVVFFLFFGFWPAVSTPHLRFLPLCRDIARKQKPSCKINLIKMHGLKKKMRNIWGGGDSSPEVELSAPYNFVQEVHIGFNKESGQFEVRFAKKPYQSGFTLILFLVDQGIPDEWIARMTSSGISKNQLAEVTYSPLNNVYLPYSLSPAKLFLSRWIWFYVLLNQTLATSRIHKL